MRARNRCSGEPNIGIKAGKSIALSDLEPIAADDEADTAALHGWRSEAFGEDALNLNWPWCLTARRCA